MGKILIGNIEILYDEYDDTEIERIRNIILNNPSLLADKNTIHIHDFDRYFTEVAIEIFTKNSKYFSNKDWLPALYISSLSRNNPEYKDAVVQLGDELSDDLLYSLIAYKYYEENDSLNDFVYYLMYRRDTDKIMDWLYNHYRWDTKNYLIEVIYHDLEEYDPKFLKILPDMITDYLYRAVQMMISNDSQSKMVLPNITHDELDKLFCDFLNYIKAPQEWMDTYLELKQNEKIMFVDKDTLDSECVCDSNKAPSHLVIEDDGTIDVFYTLVHEFMHYVSLSSGLVPFPILEFPSIFFEKIAAKFLKEEGYLNEVVDSVVEMRNENNFSIYINLFPVFSAVKDYIISGCSHTFREDAIKFWQENFEMIHEAEEKCGELTGEDFPSTDFSDIDISSFVDRDCDSLISTFVKNGLLAINGCQYILGTYLAGGVLKKADSDPDVVSQMVQVTSELANTNLENILTLFDIEDLFSEKDPSSKEFVKIKD